MHFGNSLLVEKSVKISDYGLSYLPIMSAETLIRIGSTSIKERPAGTLYFMSPNMKKLFDKGEYVKAESYFKMLDYLWKSDCFGIGLVIL